MTAENVCHAWTALDYPPSARTGMDGPGLACPLPLITPEVRRR